MSIHCKSTWVLSSNNGRKKKRMCFSGAVLQHSTVICLLVSTEAYSRRHLSEGPGRDVSALRLFLRQTKQQLTIWPKAYLHHSLSVALLGCSLTELLWSWCWFVFSLRVGTLAVGASDPCIESTAGFYTNMMVVIFKITFTLDYCYLMLTAVWAIRQKLWIPLHC